MKTSTTFLALCLFPLAVSDGQGIIRAQYKLPAEFDPRILGNFSTELWAEVTRPAELSPTPLPLVLLMHGNHDTCGVTREDGFRYDDNNAYTFTGVCANPNYPDIAPSHEGYRYVADLLGKESVVVSINANRINNNNFDTYVDEDSNLILARGNLFLKHLEQLARWNSGHDFTPEDLQLTLEGQLDFNNIGLMGHSRGGEACRAALYLYNEPNSTWPKEIGTTANIKAVYELGPTEGSVRDLQLNATGVFWYAVYGSCDADIPDKKAVRVFDRVFGAFDDSLERPKGTLLVAGGDHNGFNTEWQNSDSYGCNGVEPLFNGKPLNIFDTSGAERIEAQIASPNPDQQKIVMLTMVPFFRFALMGQKEEGKIFDPSYPLPDELTDITFCERGESLWLFIFVHLPILVFLTDNLAGWLRAPPQSPFASGRTTGVQVLNPLMNRSSLEYAGIQYVERSKPDSISLIHDESMTVYSISWIDDRPKYVIYKFGDGEEGLQAESFKTISFRIAVGCGGDVCYDIINDDPVLAVNVSLIVDIDGQPQQSSSVDLNSFVTIRRPTGTLLAGSNKNPQPFPFDSDYILQTVVVPMQAFEGSGYDLTEIHGIRIDISGDSQGVVYLGQVCR